MEMEDCEVFEGFEGFEVFEGFECSEGFEDFEVPVWLEIWDLEAKELLGLPAEDESPLGFEAEAELEELLEADWLFCLWDRWPIWSTSVW